jgi:hypothetical protein
MMLRLPRTVLMLGALVAAASCGDVVREGRSSVFLTIDSLRAAQGNKPGSLAGTLLSDVITNVTSPAPCTNDNPCPTVFNDVGQVILRLAPKDVSVTPTSNNQVTITRYHVAYRRADGRNTPGVDVPYGFDGGVTGTIPPDGALTLGFEIVRHVAKEESPLVQLIRESTIISTIADVTFYGTDQVGNAISVTGSILIDFGNFGD